VPKASDPKAKWVEVRDTLLEGQWQLYPLLDSLLCDRRFSGKLARRCKRTQQFNDHLKILIRCACLADINVDLENKIGPLMDSDQHSHNTKSILSDYNLHFGGLECSHFMSLLGGEVQMSPTTHPICSYNPKMLLLMTCNGETTSRSHHNELDWMRTNNECLLNTFFHCVLLEVVMVEVLIGWSCCFHEGKPLQLRHASWISYRLCFIELVL
jgi:hypothetical protein